MKSHSFLLNAQEEFTYYEFRLDRVALLCMPARCKFSIYTALNNPRDWKRIDNELVAHKYSSVSHYDRGGMNLHRLAKQLEHEVFQDERGNEAELTLKNKSSRTHIKIQLKRKI